MLDLNQRPPPCKLGRSSPGGSCPVGESGLYTRYSTPQDVSESGRVRVCPAPVAARREALKKANTESSSVVVLVLRPQLPDWEFNRVTDGAQPATFGATIRRHLFLEVAQRCRIGLYKPVSLLEVAQRFCV
jgi:hypothetical protein